MQFIFLCTGTSTGFPNINCDCEVCTSSDPKDRRLRSSVMLETDEGNRILIDSGPDVREQLLAHPTPNIDGLLLTHEHYDHVSGLDDLRPFHNLQVYALPRVCAVIRRNMPYCFDGSYPGVPSLCLNEIDGNPFNIGSTVVVPVLCLHDKLPILGYRVGKFAYLTDVTFVDDSEMKKLKDLDVLVVDALRIKPHHSHFSLQQAIDFSHMVNARRTYFTHIAHQMGLHATVDPGLPEGMHLAYDGLCLTVDGD